MALEAEIKLRIPQERVADRLLEDARVRAALKTPFESAHLDAVYYDMPDGALSKRRLSLRMRKENGVSVVCVKGPGRSDAGEGVFCREEWQAKADTIEQAVPMLIEAGAPGELQTLIDPKRMEERCRISFNRRSAILYLPDGVRADMAVDKGVIIAGGKEQPLLEMELELLFGDMQAVIDFAQALKKDYSLEREYVSKYERALRLIRSRR